MGFRYLRRLGIGETDGYSLPNFIHIMMKKFKGILNETIRKTGDEYTIFSKKGKKLGEYDSKAAAVKRLRQIEWFKRHK